jgi:uncharacterized membrane protein YgcG
MKLNHWVLTSGVAMTALLGVGLCPREAHAAGCVTTSNGTKVYAHFMPWFEDPATSGNGTWGLHWTMTNQNPNTIESNGQRQIASYYYPMIGPYGSSDPDVIEYQLLLMKYAGIDGALIDWPGTSQTSDFAKNVQNAEAFMAMTSQMGLEFAIVYEDQDVGIAYSAGVIGNEISAAMNDMTYVRNNYFPKSNYVQVNGAPLLLDFGPQTFTTPSYWSSILSVFSPAPTFLTLWYESNDAGASAQGEFPWLYTDFLTGLQNFYDDRPLGVKFGVAYPGFNTFYAAGGWPGPTWTLPYNGTSTFSQTLQLALNGGIAAIQLATWNDYGEGTMIEPTVQFGYGFLTVLQQNLGVSYSQTELELVNTLYNQRKQYAGNAGMQSQLNQASSDLANCQVANANSILNPGTSVPSTSSSSSSGSSSSGSSSSGSSSGTGSSGSSGSSGGGGTSSVCDGSGTKGLTLDDTFIDNFEEPAILPAWSAFNDETPTENIYKITQVAGGACGTAHSGEYAGMGAITVLAGGFGVGTIFNEAIDPAAGIYCADISVFNGVSFWAKSTTPGSTITINFVLPSTNAMSTNSMGQPSGGDCNPSTMQCYNHPRVAVTLTSEWAQYAVEFSAATGGSAPVGNLIQELAWLSPDATWDFSLDEIAFYAGTPPPGAVSIGSGDGGGPVSGSSSGLMSGGTSSGAAGNTASASGSPEIGPGWQQQAPSGCGCTVARTPHDVRSLVVALGVLLGCVARRRGSRAASS